MTASGQIQTLSLQICFPLRTSPVVWGISHVLKLEKQPTPFLKKDHFKFFNNVLLTILVLGFINSPFLPLSLLKLLVGTGQQRAAEPLCLGLPSADGAVAAELLPIHILNPFSSLSSVSSVSPREPATLPQPFPAPRPGLSPLGLAPAWCNLWDHLAQDPR